MTLTIPDEPTITPIRTALELWADSARQAASVAQSLAKTPFVPQSLRANPLGTTDEALAAAHAVTAANITAAILTGQEVGLEPMAALRSIDVIQGTPAMRAIALRALVLSRGHRMWVVEQTKARAVVRGVRKGTTDEQQSTWDMDRARDLGLASKENWRKQPMAMLVARATAECARLVAPDAILGVPYAIEELQDADESVPSEAKPSKRTARRKPVAETVQLPEPVVEPEVAAGPLPGAESGTVSGFNSQPAPGAPAADEVPAAREMGDGDAWPEPPADWKPEP